MFIYQVIGNYKLKTMKEHSQLRKIIYEFIMFILMIQLAGCQSYRFISPSDLPFVDSTYYTYIIHSQNSKFQLEQPVLSNGILSGKIDTVHITYHMAGEIHVYLSSDSVMKINAGNTLSIPLSGIAKVKRSGYDLWRIMRFCQFFF
jgi:hypothetical protein